MVSEHYINSYRDLALNAIEDLKNYANDERPERRIVSYREYTKDLERLDSTRPAPAATDAGLVTVAKLGGINGVMLLRHIENLRPEAQAAYKDELVRRSQAAELLAAEIRRERDLAERQLTDVVDRMSDDYLALKSQVVELSKDAARYRYLRNGSISDLPYDDHGCGPEFPTGHDLDAAIDAKISSADPEWGCEETAVAVQEARAKPEGGDNAGA